MLAILFTLGLFAGWSLFGLATLAALRANIRELRVVLTAPMLGTAMTVIPLFVVSNAGISMRVGAPPVWLVLLAGSLLALAVWRPRPPAAAAPVVGVALVGALLVGRPMFQFGFDWIANANGDMAHYVLSATQLLNHGLQTPVDFRALADNRGFATSAQELTLRGLRPGTNITLASLAAISGRQPAGLYMPMSIAIMMGSVCAAGALAMQASRRWWAASVAGVLLIVSPLAAYGVLQELLPQDWGLGLAASLFAWLMRPEIHRSRRPELRDIAVISLLAAALFLVAYEVAAALLIGYGLYVLLLLCRREISLRAVVPLWSVPVLATVIAANTFLSKAVDYLIHYVLRFGTTAGSSGISLFGYAVVPPAIPGAAGLRSLFAAPSTPNMTFFIVTAAAFFVGLVVVAVVTALKGAAASTILLGSLIVGIMLAKNGNEFGLFKLYMYVQPFVAATLALSLSYLRDRRLAAPFVGVIGLLVIGQVPIFNAYVSQSRNPVDLRHASAFDLLPYFRQSVSEARAPVVVNVDNFALGRLEAAAVGNRRVYFIGRNLFDLPWLDHSVTIRSQEGVRRLTFSENADASRVLSRGSCLLIVPSGSQVIYNRQLFPEGSPGLAVSRCRDTKNVLAFIVSSLGQAATLPDDPRAVSFWQLEEDPFFEGQTFAGAGRYALFQILNGSSTVRVALNFTTTPLGSRRAQMLPAASVEGSERVRFPVVGSGSARVFSPPLRPRIIDGRPYIVLDMGRRGRLPDVPRPGLAGLWGKSVILDPRALTSYVRDVSLVAEDEYRKVTPPMAIRSIPADLANPNLEYSGIYEDGLIGRVSYARLAGGPQGRLRARVEVLPRSEGQRLQVLVNGHSVYSRSVAPGVLEVNVPVAASRAPRKVVFRWAGVTRLRAPDRRSAAARLTFLALSG
jgi:hypothetical protein